MRREKKLTQAQLAADLNIEISQISRIERGIINTSILSLKSISSLLDTSLPELLDFDSKGK